MEDPWAIASKIYDPCYIGGWTAGEHWNLAEQLFRKTVAVTARRVRRKETAIQGFPFRIKRIGSSRFFGARTLWRGKTRKNFSDPSRTVIDLLDDPSMGRGIRQARRCSGHLLPLRASRRQPVGGLQAPVWQPSGLQAAELPFGNAEPSCPRSAQRVQEGMSSGISLVDPSQPAQGQVLRRWNPRVNGRVRSWSLSDW